MKRYALALEKEGVSCYTESKKQTVAVIDRRDLQMQNFFLGDYIRQRRLELGLTQEQVCEGICEPITLSRIENGKQTPSRVRINAILQRLDLPDDRYYALLTKNELEIEALEKEIVACNVTGRVEEGIAKLEKLKAFAEEESLIQQFIIRSRLLLGQVEKRYTPQEEIEILTQAIHLTVPDFDIEEIEKKLYTRDEIKIINQIANAYSCAGNQKKAADIFYQLLKYIRKHKRETITTIGVFPMISHNYSRVLDLAGRYEEGVQYALEGKDACIKYGHYQYLPGCIEIYGECCYFLGRIEESRKAYRQAYYICEAIGEQKNLQVIVEEAKKYLNMEFED